MGKCKDCKHLCRTLPAYPGPHEFEEQRIIHNTNDRLKEQFEPRPRQIKRLTWCINPNSTHYKSDVKIDATEECFEQYVPVKREPLNETKRKPNRSKDSKYKNAGVSDRRPKSSDKPSV